jgi:hypothetical protein
MHQLDAQQQRDAAVARHLYKLTVKQLDHCLNGFLRESKSLEQAVADARRPTPTRGAPPHRRRSNRILARRCTRRSGVTNSSTVATT